MSLIKNLISNVSSSRQKNTGNQRRLHIGGLEPREGWEILNANAGEHVDHVGQADDLTRFEDNSFHEVYASHVLEHMDFTGEMQRALKEWHRVLVPNGKIYISIPDLNILAQLFLKNELSLNEKFGVVKMMFGAHVDAYDYHKVGLDLDLLNYFMAEAGFKEMERVSDFGIFKDTSVLKYCGVPISINVIATKPGN